MHVGTQSTEKNGFHKWESVKCCMHGLNRNDLCSIISLRIESVFIEVLCHRIVFCCIVHSGHSYLIHQAVALMS